MTAPTPTSIIVSLLELDARGRRLLAALFVRARAPELTLVHRWLDSRAGIGLVVVGRRTRTITGRPR
jgi:hypothetical protein